MKPIIFEGYEFYSVLPDGTVQNTKTGRVLKTDLTNVGYKRVTLYVASKGKLRISVHRLVAMHYIPNPENKKFVNHIDGNKLNNHYSNLEWVTCKENTIHAFKTGLRTGHNRLPDAIVKDIKNLHKNGYGRKNLCIKFGLKKSRIDDILGRYYKDI